MADRSVVHATFIINRTYKATPERVFAAWADPEKKRLWFGTPDPANPAHIFEFRVGGREYSEGAAPDGKVYTFDVTYEDIVPNERIVYSYDMTLSGQRISVSLGTIELKPEGDGTRLTYTEQGAFLDGLDEPRQRELGTIGLLDALGASLDK